MSLITLVLALVVNTLISVGIGALWYSFKGFGKIWAEKYYGSLKNFETHPKKHSQELVMGLAIICPLIYNLLLVFLINNVYSPRTVNDALTMTFFLTLIHVLLELSHIGFENRSYTAFLVHVTYHLVITFIPIMVLRIFFSMPKLNINLNV